jgi:hypothetical protein
MVGTVLSKKNKNWETYDADEKDVASIRNTYHTCAYRYL